MMHSLLFSICFSDHMILFWQGQIDFFLLLLFWFLHFPLLMWNFRTAWTHACSFWSSWTWLFTQLGPAPFVLQECKLPDDSFLVAAELMFPENCLKWLHLSSELDQLILSPSVCVDSHSHFFSVILLHLLTFNLLCYFAVQPERLETLLQLS